LYGATAGKAFFRGKAGERFCVRNSGALAVVEGVGDHGCEYMTGGAMVCLGETGRNFGAGMSGGMAYIYDPEGKFPARCNMGLVGLETIDSPEESDEVYNYIKEHVEMTGSSLGQEMLDNWDMRAGQFVKVFPHDFKRVLLERSEKAAEAA
jgi:glutamate synthase (NADPH/NADH)